MDKTQENNITAQGTDSPEVKKKHAGGRHPKGWYEADVQEVLNGGARLAARILRAHLEQSKGHKTIKDSVLKICFYVIDHAIGKARQKVVISGGVLTYRALAEGAEKLNAKPRPILAEVFEIANKYDKEHPDQVTKTLGSTPESDKNKPNAT